MLGRGEAEVGAGAVVVGAVVLAGGVVVGAVVLGVVVVGTGVVGAGGVCDVDAAVGDETDGWGPGDDPHDTTPAARANASAARAMVRVFRGRDAARTVHLLTPPR